MDKSQAKTFGDELEAVFGIFGKPTPSVQIKTIWWRILINYDLNSVLKALEHHASHGKFFPKPADIIELLTTDDGRPSADEAWAIALQGQSEEASVVWTEEISQAWFTSALPIMEVGDKVGARVAFRDNYNRRVEYARRNGIAAAWFMSAGNNKQITHDVAIEAERLGRMSSKTTSKYLISDMTDEGREIVGAIGFSGSNVKPITSSELHKERVAQMREDLKNSNELAEKKRQELIDKEKRELESRREFLMKQAGINQ